VLSADSVQQEQADTEEMINILEELIAPLRQNVLVNSDTIYVPSCIGVISKYPWYDLLKDWLVLLNWAVQEAEFDFPLERYVINFMQEIPLPPPGKLEIAIQFSSYTLYCSRPPLNACPLIKNVKSFFT
jgi:hypothetical protein